MPKFSQSSFSKLTTCHPDLQALMFEVIKYFDCTILEGYRNEADQEKAFNAGNTKLHWPHGKHNGLPSMAIDVAPSPRPDWNKTSDFIYFGGIVMGIACMLKESGKMTHSVRYGGDFNQNDRITDSKFLDSVHFELIA